MLRLLEGFDFYGYVSRTGVALSTDLERRHPSSSLVGGDGDLITGRGGDGTALRFTTYQSYSKIYFTRFDSSQSNTWIMGFAMKPGDFTYSFHQFFNSHSDVVSLYSYQRCLYIRRAGAGSTDYETLNYTVKPNRWYYFEIKIYHHNTSGTVEVRINGQTVYSNTDIDTLGDYTPGTFVLQPASANMAFDDVYICDGTGSDNNDFLGPIKVETLRPDGDDGAQSWTPSSGSNHYELVDSSNLWQLTDYIETSGDDVDDLWTFDDLSKINGTVYGVQTIVSGWTETAMPQALKLICDSNSTLDYSEARGLGVETDYPMPHETIWETDPDTSNAWTVNGINDVSFGVRKI